jgi:hypothetical protein
MENKNWITLWFMMTYGIFLTTACSCFMMLGVLTLIKINKFYFYLFPIPFLITGLITFYVILNESKNVNYNGR